MRALVFDQSLRLDLNHAEPATTGGDTLIHVHTAGICSTDLEIVKGYMNFAGILGHEFVGEVIDSPKRELIGQRVVGEINCVCGDCDLCRRGLSTHCRNRSVLGIFKHDGAFADYVRLPASNLHIVPGSVDDESAVFVEPLAAAFQIPKQVSIDPGQSISVIGDGRLGLLVAQVLRNTGAAVTMIGKHPEKLRLCDAWQIRTQLLSEVEPKRNQDVVVDCTGSASGLELAMQVVRPRGTIVLKSTFAASKPLNLAPIVIDEITVVGSRCGPFANAIAALAAGAVDVRSLIHARMSLDDSTEAMAVAARPGVLKVLLSIRV